MLLRQGEKATVTDADFKEPTRMRCDRDEASLESIELRFCDLNQSSAFVGVEVWFLVRPLGAHQARPRKYHSTLPAPEDLGIECRSGHPCLRLEEIHGDLSAEQTFADHGLIVSGIACWKQGRNRHPGFTGSWSCVLS
jgi:hypothetical protein